MFKMALLLVEDLSRLRQQSRESQRGSVDIPFFIDKPEDDSEEGKTWSINNGR